MNHISPHCIINIVVYIGYNVSNPDHFSFFGKGFVAIILNDNTSLPFRMFQYPIPDLSGKIKALSFLFKDINHSETLLIMPEASCMNSIQNLFPCVSKRCMSEVMAKRNGFNKIFIQSKRPCNGPSNLGHLKGMSQPRSVMIASRCKKDLGFVLESSECFAMSYPVTIMLKGRSNIALCLLSQSSSCLSAPLRKGSQYEFLSFFQL